MARKKKKVKPWTYVKRKKKALTVGLGLAVVKGALSALSGAAAKVAAKGAGMALNPKTKTYPRPLSSRVKRLRSKRVAAARTSSPKKAKKATKRKSYATPPWLTRARGIVRDKMAREGLQPKKYEVTHLLPTGKVTVKAFSQRPDAERYLKAHPGGSLTLLVKDRQDRLRSVPYPSKHTGTTARTFFMGKLLANKPKTRRKKPGPVFGPGNCEYRTVDTRTVQGIEEAERLKESGENDPDNGWHLAQSGLSRMVFYRRRSRSGRRENPGRRNPGSYTVEWDSRQAGVTASRRHSSDKTLLAQLTYLREKGLAYTVYDSRGEVLETHKGRLAKNPGVDYHAKYRTLSDQDLGAYAFTARSVEEARAKALAEGKRRRAWGCWLTRKGNVRGEHLVVSNPGPAYHKREQKRYAKLLGGDLKAKHHEAADYWQGALSAESAAVAAGKTKRNPLLMVVPNDMGVSKAWYIKFPGGVYALGPVRFAKPVDEREARRYAAKWAGVKRLPSGFECWPTNDPPPRNNPDSRKRELWQRAFTRILLRKYAGTVKILKLKKVFDHADRLYAEGKSPTAAVAVVGKMSVKSLMNPATRSVSRNPKRNPRGLSVPEQHQLKIALRTLRLSPMGARMLGGMNHEEAKRFLKRVGYTDAQIAKLAKNPGAAYHARKAAQAKRAYKFAEERGADLAAERAWARGQTHRESERASKRVGLKNNPMPAALSVVMNRGDDMQSLMKDPRFAKAAALYRKFHGCDPQSVSRRLIPMGGKQMVGREFFVSLGKAPSEAYTPGRRSKKAGNIYVHPYDRKPEKVVSADGRTIITLPGSHKVTDWIRG